MVLAAQTQEAARTWARDKAPLSLGSLLQEESIQEGPALQKAVEP